MTKSTPPEQGTQIVSGPVLPSECKRRRTCRAYSRSLHSLGGAGHKRGGYLFLGMCTKWADSNILKLGVVVLIALGVIIARVVIEARTEWRLGNKAFTQGHLTEAIDHYRRCARWYAPGLSYHSRALARLSELAAKAEHAGQTGLALTAYRSARGAIFATRSFYTPDTARLANVNARIAWLMANETPAPVYAHLSVEARRKIYLDQLKQNNRPNSFWGMLALVGFALGATGAHRFFTRAVDSQWRWVRAELRWAWLFALGFMLFSIGLRLA